MTEQKPQYAADPLQPTEESKEMTDKIHRLVRSFSRQLVDLIYKEIGARKVVLKGKPGPKPGHKMPLGLCPVCRLNKNSRRRFGFICKDCSAGKPIGFRTKMREHFKEHRPAKQRKRDKLGKDWRIRVQIPQHLPVQPQDVPIEEIPDAEPGFLDLLREVVEVPEAPKVEQKPSEAPARDAEDEEWFT